MILTRLARIQLIIFAIITVVCVGAITLFYLKVPEKLGFGANRVTAEFVASGGLYPAANVTYRGVTVGRVESVSLTEDGVAAHMRLDSGPKIPANVTATVKSVSAIGEQYIDLVPPDEPSQALLDDGSHIDRQNTAIGQDIAGLLTDANQLVSSIGDTKLQELLHETFRAFNGSGPELARLIESARLFVDQANADWPQTERLIDQADPFLDALVRSGDDIQALSGGLARFTTELRQADPQVRSLLQTAPGATENINTTFSGIRPSFPMLAANLANLGRVGVIYHKSIEQALVIFPALFAALLTVAGGVPADEGGKLDFKIDLGDPPPCTTGFLPTPFIRSPADTTLRDLPNDMYCKVRAERSQRGPRRPQLPVYGVPRQAGAHHCSFAAIRAAMCRSATTRGGGRRSPPVRLSRIRGTHSRPTSIRTFHRRTTRIRGRRMHPASIRRPGRRPGRGPRPISRGSRRRRRAPGRRHNGRRTIRRGRRRGRGRSTKFRLTIRRRHFHRSFRPRARWFRPRRRRIRRRCRLPS